MESLNSGLRSRWWWLGLTLLAACSANSADPPSTTTVVTVRSSIPVVDWLPSDAGGPPRGSDITALEKAELDVACRRLYGVEAYTPAQAAEAGYQIGFFGGPGVITVGAEGQENFAFAIGDACASIVDEWYPQKVYSYEEEYEMKIESAECIRDLGYPVEDAPTMEAWIESSNDSSSSHWDPYTLILDMLSMDDAEAVRVQCEGE